MTRRLPPRNKLGQFTKRKKNPWGGRRSMPGWARVSRRNREIEYGWKRTGRKQHHS